jgi:hypothetical protein
MWQIDGRWQWQMMQIIAQYPLAPPQELVEFEFYSQDGA